MTITWDSITDEWEIKIAHFDKEGGAGGGRIRETPLYMGRSGPN